MSNNTFTVSSMDDVFTLVERVNDLIDRYGCAAVADVKELFDLNGCYSDLRFGWTQKLAEYNLRVYLGGVDVTLPEPVEFVNDRVPSDRYHYDENLLIQARDLYGHYGRDGNHDGQFAVIALIANAYDITTDEAETKIVTTATDAYPILDAETTTDGPLTDGVTEYRHRFGHGNKNWKTVLEYNQMFIRQVEGYLNRKLADQGHLFLNEVYEELGLPHTPAGAVKGWLAANESHVSLGMNLVPNNDGSIALRIETDGVIYDKI